MRNLQTCLNDFEYDDLPVAWNTFDLTSFSRTKRLREYQQDALESALKGLWKYYGDLADYQPREGEDVTHERKRLLRRWYEDNLDEAIPDLPLPKTNGIQNLLAPYYPIANSRIPYESFINRMGFWMATGSGKTLLIVKMLELLWQLIARGEIPPRDILVLTHREDLLWQIKTHVDEFNAAHGEPFIRLRDLREYSNVKRETPSLFKEHELTVFTYRSDNLSDEQKERIIDFRNYDNEGHWYILLDEAHKGDKEDSKRQHIYSILSRNGFLFNFSATFTDPRDILTTTYNFNLARFIGAGYGKHISILQQEIRGFGKDEDYTHEEKQKVVLKALLLLAYIRRSHEALPHAALPRTTLYHKPLLVALVNSVNTEDADLRLFFREMERIGRGEIADATWQEAKAELWEELAAGPALLFEEETFDVDAARFQALTPADVLACVYHAQAPGATEVLRRPSNRQEIAFKLKSADRPFALIRIGDITPWMHGELAGYEVNDSLDDDEFFEGLNAPDSDITILLGSRSFYEGWDSNRPNIITFINIGTTADASKFVLQSVGRGVRIAPLKDKRRRLQALCNAGEVDDATYRLLRGEAQVMETLFIMGTNRAALNTVIERLKKEEGKEAEHKLSLYLNDTAIAERPLLVPVYHKMEHPLIDEATPVKFPIVADELEYLKGYVEHLGDDRLLLALHGVTPRGIKRIRRTLAAPDTYFNTAAPAQRYGSPDLLIARLLRHFGTFPQAFERLAPLEDHIKSFREITVSLADITDLKVRIERVRAYPTRDQHIMHLREQRARYEIDDDQYDEAIVPIRQMKAVERFPHPAGDLEIRHITQHYYVPVLVSPDSKKLGYIKPIIDTPSEVRFLGLMEEYVGRPDQKLASFDWWLFSRIEEKKDLVRIPYYAPSKNSIQNFYPDFVFWLQRGDNLFVLFVDPKGMTHADYQHKLDAFRQFFQEPDGTPRVLAHDGLSVRFFLGMFTDDANKAPAGYRSYWFDNIPALVSELERYG